MHGQFIPGTEDIYGNRRQNINIEDTPHNYLILDIETDSPEYEELCLDLTKVRHWMEATYPWITEDTGMILYQTASAGVLRTDGTEKHKQIRKQMKNLSIYQFTSLSTYQIINISIE